MSGLMYRRNRYYDPATGQFTQSDPIGIAGGLNTDGFAAGDPISFSDPFGLCPYEGETRTHDVESCPDDDRKEVFRDLANDPLEGHSTVKELNIGQPGGAAAAATTAVHEGEHLSDRFGDLFSARQEEGHAWNAALNFYDRLQPALQTSVKYNIASRIRAHDPAGFWQR